MGAYMYRVGDVVKRRSNGRAYRVEDHNVHLCVLLCREGDGPLVEVPLSDVEPPHWTCHSCGAAGLGTALELESHQSKCPWFQAAKAQEMRARAPEVQIPLAPPAPGRNEYVVYLPDGEVRATSAHELGVKLRERGINAYMREDHLVIDRTPPSAGIVVAPHPDGGPASELMAEELMRTINAPMDERTRILRDAMLYGSAVMAVDWSREAHNREGYCPACEWSYCRVREVKAEPRIRCAGCAAGAETLNFQGGGCFDYPLEAGSEEEPSGLPDSAVGGDASRDEEENLCAACAAKVAAFIKHLRDTHGGRR